MAERKYRKGPPIEDIDELVAALGCELYVWWFNRPVHYAWMDHMSLKTLRRAVESGRLYRAIPNEQHKETTCG